METEERRRSRASSSKTPQNGGKRVNGLTTEEEEARRRELVKEKLRSQLELEKRAQMVVERLLEDSVADDFLAHCAKFITPADYKDAIEERFIAKMCGYPVCPNKLGKIPTQQYRICTRTNKVYDITERKCFCSNFCYKASKEFEVQISKTPLWLRQDESHPEIKLTKKGDGGRSGEEVMLSVRPLQKKDIENLPTAQPEEPHASQQYHAADGLSHSHSDSRDMEQEQDFVSSVVSQQQGRRVHWGDLPKRTDGDDKGKESSVEEATAKMNVCSLSETVTQTLSPPVNSTPAPAEHTTALISPPFIDSKPPTENKPLPSLTPTTTHLNSNNTTVPTQPGLSITQVGMSKKGAAGLRDLLKNHTVASKPDSVRQNLLECLRRTLKEWSTDETLKFLYGADHPLDYPFTDVREEADGEEELDEDDFEEGLSVEDGRGADAGALMGPPAAAPDYKTMRKETQQLELRVREFYKGTWILPEEGEAPNENKVTVQDWGEKEPVLPLVDSHSQHLIQKRITVEKLTNCLRNIVGSLHLTMSDVSANLNSLVKTFRFTNTNIIHKTPEWTLIALVLLHLLAAVSAVVREALQTTASVEYSNTLMEELGLQEQDLLNLVHMLKPQHPDTHTQ
ncbi:putative RNA polymerase II subunit B1 CTD phosphatase RPAP2 isoform 2 [Scophthalmus maximus]|uniref:RNA polymerase II subunit B1 CTD phosphatase RPAP2 homolog n=1 Tax=Scophthalmus maximus TaxID=52904 RepID=A0A2U9BKX8_SCOMX|nr:putative RNA polymerase II subunit B1 CTD phosphatase RPAP2 isoform 2 [Scophthalmus maximus]